MLFLGFEKAPHSSATVFGPLASALARRGIQLIYVPTAAEAFAAGRLSHYDALMVFGDQTFTADQQKALAAFVDNGKGVLAIHSPSLVGQVGSQPAAAQPLAVSGDRRDRPGGASDRERRPALCDVR